jgi:hypothetical protein
MSYEELMQFIQKNKAIPNYLATLSPDTPSVKELKQAIETGDFNADIWKTEQCNLDLVYLCKEKIITPKVFTTSYFYLLLRMPLRPEHAHLAFNEPIEIKKLSENNCLTKDGEQYLTQLLKDLSKIDINISFDELKTFVLSLPPTEQWLIKIQYPDSNSTERDTSRMFRVLGKNIPLFQYSKKEGFIFFHIPSYSLIKFVLDRMPYPIEPMLCFGTVGLKTLHKLHEEGKHPVSIYALQVLSNLMTADEHKDLLPIVIALHDIAHCYWGSRLDRKYLVECISALDALKKELEKIEYNEKLPMQSLVNQFKQEIVPHVKKDESKTLLDQLEQSNDVESILAIMPQFIDLAIDNEANWLVREYIHFIKRLDSELHLDLLNVDKMKNRILDFDLSGVKKFSIEQYVRLRAIRQGHPVSLSFPGEYGLRAPIPLGEHPWELLYFVLAKLIHNQATSHRKLYQEILKYIPIRGEFWDPSEILQILAKHSLDPSGLFSKGISSNEKINVDWTAWLTLLETHKTSQELYHAIQASDIRHHEWRKLTLEKGLCFCHPLIPLTEEKRNELRSFLEKSRNDELTGTLQNPGFFRQRLTIQQKFTLLRIFR